MTQDNLFREVEEDLERQRYEALWKKYGGLVIATVAAIIIGTTGATLYEKHQIKVHEAASGELMSVMGDDKLDDHKRIDQLMNFAEATNSTAKAQATFAQLAAGDLAAKNGDTPQAISIYDAIAADAKADNAFRQLADLFSVELQLDKGDPAALQARLDRLSAFGEPWRYTAMEYSGFLAIRAGDTPKARTIFTALSQEAGAPKTITARAADMLKLLGSS